MWRLLCYVLLLELEPNDRLDADALDGDTALDARVVPPARDRLQRGIVEHAFGLRVDHDGILDRSSRRDRETNLHPAFETAALGARRILGRHPNQRDDVAVRT